LKSPPPPKKLKNQRSMIDGWSPKNSLYFSSRISRVPILSDFVGFSNLFVGFFGKFTDLSDLTLFLRNHSKRKIEKFFFENFVSNFLGDVLTHFFSHCFHHLRNEKNSVRITCFYGFIFSNY